MKFPIGEMWSIILEEKALEKLVYGIASSSMMPKDWQFCKIWSQICIQINYLSNINRVCCLLMSFVCQFLRTRASSHLMPNQFIQFILSMIVLICKNQLKSIKKERKKNVSEIYSIGIIHDEQIFREETLSLPMRLDCLTTVSINSVILLFCNITNWNQKFGLQNNRWMNAKQFLEPFADCEK